MSNYAYQNSRTEHWEKLEQCPYHPAHQVRPGTRLQLHLIKCRRNILADKTSPYHNRAMEIEICPFNSTHHIHKDRMKVHLTMCKDRVIDDGYLNYEQENNGDERFLSWKNTSLPTSQASNSSHPMSHSKEDWDDEPAVFYNPLKKIQGDKNLLFNPQGLTRSERRMFRQDRRVTFDIDSRIGNSRLSADTSCASQAAPTNSDSSYASKAKSSVDKPLTRPVLPESTSHGRGVNVEGQARANEIDNLANNFGEIGLGRGRGRGRGTRPRNPGFHIIM